MPTLEKILAEKKANFGLFINQIAKKNNNMSNPIFNKYRQKLADATLDEFLLYIKTQLLPIGDNIEGFVRVQQLQLNIQLEDDDRIKMERYIQLFIKIVTM